MTILGNEAHIGLLDVFASVVLNLAPFALLWRFTVATCPVQGKYFIFHFGYFHCLTPLLLRFLCKSDCSNFSLLI